MSAASADRQARNGAVGAVLLRAMLGRLAQLGLVLLATAALTFALAGPLGDPVSQLTGLDTSPVEQAKLRQGLGLDDPAPLQFARHLAQLARLDLGMSWQSQQPVAALLLSRLPATAELALAGTVLGLILGLPVGILAALLAGRPGAAPLLALSSLGLAVPTFVIGTLLTWLFAVELGWLPAFGRGGTVQLGPWSTGLLTTAGWRSLALPALTLGFYQAALIARLLRGEVLSVLQQDHVRTARAFGLGRLTLLFRHVLPNVLLPTATALAMQFGTLLAFALITEAVFQWPGLGLLLLQAIQAADLPVIVGCLLLTALSFTLLSLAVDLVAPLLDPRVRHGSSEAA